MLSLHRWLYSLVFCSLLFGAGYFCFGQGDSQTGIEAKVMGHEQALLEQKAAQQSVLQQMKTMVFPHPSAPVQPGVVSASSETTETIQANPDPGAVNAETAANDPNSTEASQNAEQMNSESVPPLMNEWAMQADRVMEKQLKNDPQAHESSHPSPGQPVAVSPNFLEVNRSPSASNGLPASASGAGSVSFASLSAVDYGALNSPVKGSISDQLQKANGALCVAVQQSCEYKNDYEISSRAWGMKEVLDENVDFKIKNSSGSVSFDIGFKVLTNNNQQDAVLVHAVPTQVKPHREFKNSKNYRVLDFHFPDMKIHGESVNQVHASLVYEETADGMVLTPESQFSFNRSGVQVDVSSGTAGSASTVTSGASNDVDYFTAEEMRFSINIEKSL